ncbi:MAG TPA: MarR family transcriptional regulator [Mycobacteriales bacterium]|nr:MarR family transcriptional regulator [Mycobacteriales bacterium]
MARGDDDLGIVDALAQLSFAVQGMLARRASAYDLSMIQTRLLGVLRDREPTMQELARLLGLDKSSVSGLVDRAQRRGLVQRTPALDDRRAVRVKLTSSGRRIVDTVATRFSSDIASVTGSLSAPDTKQLSRLATRVVREYDGSAPVTDGQSRP